MNLKFNKYRRQYAGVILASYLMLITISILHYHKIDLQSGNYSISSDKQKSACDPSDKLDDVTHECTIQHFTETIINFNFIPVFNAAKEITVQNISFKEIIRLLHSPVDYNNPLRAPPLFS